MNMANIRMMAKELRQIRAEFEHAVQMLSALKHTRGDCRATEEW